MIGRNFCGPEEILGPPALDNDLADAAGTGRVYCIGVVPFVTCRLLPPPPTVDPNYEPDTVYVKGQRPAPEKDEQTWCERWNLLCAW